MTDSAFGGFFDLRSSSAPDVHAGIYEPARQSAPRRNPLQEIKEGADFVLYHPLLRPVFITQFIFNTGWFLMLAVFVPYAVRRLELSAAGVGTTLAMFGVGMVIGALLATRVMRRLPFGIVIGLGPVIGFAAACVMALTTIVPSPVLAGAEACLYVAVAIFGAQALVILMSPAVSLARQPEMVDDGPKVLRAC